MRGALRLVLSAAVASLLASTAIADGAPSVLVLDKTGGGIDLGGKVSTTLFGAPLTVRWTKASPTNAFLVIDATKARAGGYELRSGSGEALSGIQLVRGGLRLRSPNGNEILCTDGWALLRKLDSSSDGKVTSSDASWPWLELFTDTNADGRISSSEVSSLPNSSVAGINTSHGAARTDSFGNTLSNGTYTRTNGSTRTAAGAVLKQLTTARPRLPYRLPRKRIGD